MKQNGGPGGARAIAKVWNEQAERGIDPKAEIKKTRQQELLEQRRTFGSVVQDYIAWLPQRPATAAWTRTSPLSSPTVEFAA